MTDAEEIKAVTESSMFLMFGDMGSNKDGNGSHRNKPLYLKPVVIHYTKEQSLSDFNEFDYSNIFLKD